MDTLRQEASTISNLLRHHLPTSKAEHDDIVRIKSHLFSVVHTPGGIKPANLPDALQSYRIGLLPYTVLPTSPRGLVVHIPNHAETFQPLEDELPLDRPETLRYGAAALLTRCGLNSAELKETPDYSTDAPYRFHLLGVAHEVGEERPASVHLLFGCRISAKRNLQNCGLHGVRARDYLASDASRVNLRAILRLLGQVYDPCAHSPLLED